MYGLTEDFVSSEYWFAAHALTVEQPTHEAVLASLRLWRSGKRADFLRVNRSFWTQRTSEVRRLTGDVGVD